MERKSSEFDGYTARNSRTTTYASNGGVNIVKNGGGFIRSITFSQVDAAPTAGAITIYDVASTSVYGDSASILFKNTFTTTAFVPFTVVLDKPFSSGLAVGHDTAVKDIEVNVSYK